MIRVRAAQPSDWARLLSWRSDPETVAQFRESSAPTVAEHMTWMAKIIRDERSRLYVADDSEIGLSVGTARLDLTQRKDETWAECSVTVEPRARGRGYAAQLVAYLVLQAQAERMSGLIARVKPGNFASLRAFASCDFLPMKSKDDLVTLERRL